MCGEHREIMGELLFYRGSSPHVRGALVHTADLVLQSGIIPACAGSTKRAGKPRRGGRDHPRMCGEHEDGMRWDLVGEGSSPHVRGALKFQSSLQALARDHPRMCGEH